MIGIIAAMEIERNAFRSKMEHVESQTISGIAFDCGKLGNHEVVLMLSGVGKGKTAMSTTIMLEHFPISHIISIGTAGGIIQSQQILDIVISDEVVQHDFDTSPIDGEEGIGMYFQADKKLAQLFMKELNQSDYQVFHGLIASGDAFITLGENMDRILHHFPKALCCEMEAGAIAQVATHYECPFIIIQSLSDVACHPDSHMDYMQYAKIASERSASFVEKALISL